MWAAPHARRLASRAAAGAAGLGALAGAQAVALEARYEALPDARGPTRGIARPGRGVAPAVAERVVVKPPTFLAAGAPEGFANARRRGLVGEGRSTSAGGRDPPPDDQHHHHHHRLSKTTKVPTRRNANTRNDAARNDRRPRPRPRPRIRVALVGDSLVTGVGVSPGADGRGPTLPRRVGERLADVLGASVEWIALGKTAADAETIRTRVVPKLAEALEDAGGTETEGGPGSPDTPAGSIGSTQTSARSRTTLTSPLEEEEEEEASEPSDAEYAAPKPFTAAVLLCGVNDFKRFFSEGRTPARFKRELERLLADVRAIVGPECVVFLPGMPMHSAVAFPPPLSVLAVYASREWDEVKKIVASENETTGGGVVSRQEVSEGASFGDTSGGEIPSARAARANVVYVTEPTREQMRRFGEKVTAPDGIHPNEFGYDAWAEHIAKEIAKRVPGEVRRECAKGNREKGTTTTATDKYTACR
jgi:lysophospholipase L1-like esterase